MCSIWDALSRAVRRARIEDHAAAVDVIGASLVRHYGECLECRVSAGRER